MKLYHRSPTNIACLLSNSFCRYLFSRFLSHAFPGTVTHEEVLREPREWCVHRSETCLSFLQRKFFYLLTCEYCFSHYVTAAFLFVTRFTMLYTGWRGYLVAGFSLVWVANVYMSAFGRLRLEIKHEHVEIEADKQKTVAGANPTGNPNVGSGFSRTASDEVDHSERTQRRSISPTTMRRSR